MSSFQVKTKAFNGNVIDVKIELFLDGLIKINKNIKKNDVISTRVYTDAQSIILETLQNSYSKLRIDKVGFTIISRDLEILKNQMLIPNTKSLVNAIHQLVMNNICDNISIDNKLDFDKKIEILNRKEDEFIEFYLGRKKQYIKNKKLLRVIHLNDEKKYKEAFTILGEINTNELSKFENEEFVFTRFQLFLKNVKEDVEPIFRNLIDEYSENPRQIKRLYFEYIRFLENLRDERKPQKMIREFECKYPISFLSNGELAWYYYLKGRAEYGRGDFLFALENLSFALENVDKDNERLLASIYNTSVNSFTDNLFFNEAKIIAKNTFQIRKKNDYSELYETVSLQGGIEFKSANFKKAFNYFIESEIMFKGKALTNSNPSRGYNYISKSAIMSGKFDIARKYLDKANEVGDRKGFSKAIELLFYLKQNNYAKMDEVYKESIMLPENHLYGKYDNFAIGWGYTFMALSSFEQKKFKNGIQHLVKAIDNFMDDLYLLEAFYVSLYLYQYALPEDEIQRFRDLTADFDLKNEFEEYITKHIMISEQYANIFDVESNEINILKQFYDDTKEINDENYNPELVKQILNSICLM